MKTIKYIFAVITISILLQNSLFCQDNEPEQVKLLYKGDSVYLNSQHPDFVQNEFILGWHWGGSKKISQALDMNQYDAEYYQDTSFMNDNVYSILKPEHIWTHYDNTNIMNTKGIVFEPTLLINKNDDPKVLKTRVGDKTNPVFGFQKIKGYISNDSNYANYSRLIIRDSLANEVILDEPSHSYTLFYQNRGYDAFDSNSVKYFGYGWYISINLKRISNATGNPNDTILKIELPYKVGQDTTNYSIRFDSIPCLSPDSSYFLPNSRGLVQKLRYVAEKPYEFYVFRSMLPYDTSITISAFFICDRFDINNHHLKHYINSADNSQIDSLKIKVTYLGGCDLAIDNIVYETPNTQNLRCGYYDSQIITSYQNGLNQYNQPQYTSKNIKLFRFNPHVEGHIQNWCGERYVNKLVGNINSSENNCFFAKLFEYYVNPPNRWLGMYQFNNLTAAPYCWQTNMFHDRVNNSVLTMGIAFGREGRFTKDSLNSEYELWLYGSNNNSVSISEMLTKSESEYSYIINRSSSSVQKKHESKIYEYYAGQNSGFIFSDKFWWAQNFILNDWHWSKDSASHTTYSKIPLDSRPLTGEELRLSCWNALIMGAKGLFYDGPDFNDDSIDNDLSSDPKTYSNTRLQHYNHAKIFEPNIDFDYMSDEEFLDSDNPYIGGDFISSIYEPNSLYAKLQNKDSIAFNMGTTQDKLYIGRRSLRLELKKIHDQIRRCEDELMKLRLVAWMGKGYRLWNNHHPDYPDDSTFRRFLAWDEANNRIDTTRFASNKI
ncbi:MAG TPA: hypothetical protein PKY56_09275 [Candidatus Kapabacteria bacterium]|nr:hypothetical protein [Candidatus Kapabacteria bacterium]HPO62831.1 hypothetical protein [Candidatus Kapabacteria bacterium]